VISLAELASYDERWGVARLVPQEFGKRAGRLKNQWKNMTKELSVKFGELG